MIYLVGSNLEFEGVKTLVLNEIKINKFSVNLAEFDALVLTSKNSVNALRFNQISPADLQIYSIGEGTSRAGLASLEFTPQKTRTETTLLPRSHRFYGVKKRCF